VVQDELLAKIRAALERPEAPRQAVGGAAL
jgi:hypothetical protein